MFYHAFLAVYTLARAGELRALTWADVDLEGMTISINKTCDPKTGIKNCPKNGESRLIPINAEIRKILLELREMTCTAALRFAGAFDCPPLSAAPYQFRNLQNRWCTIRRAVCLFPKSSHIVSSISLSTISFNHQTNSYVVATRLRTHSP